MKTRRLLKGVIVSSSLILLCCCVPDEVILYGDISGIVSDTETNEPIDSANVELSQNSDVLDTDITEDDGSYLFKNISPGNYTISASKARYARFTAGIQVKSVEPNQQNFSLTMAPYPEISVSFLDFGYEANSRSFTIKNIGAGQLDYSFQAAPEWVTLTPKSGEVTDEVDTITVTINRGAISDETYKEQFRILSLSGDEDVWDTVKVFVNGLADEDGNYYKILTLGTQTWMAENLNTGTIKHFAGDLVLSDNGVIEKYCYDNNEANCDNYGGLYSWDEMMDYVSADEAIFNDKAGWNDFYNIQGICPIGWHIPSWDEWETLLVFVGKALGGATLKANSSLWEGDTIKTDEYGFGVLPGGGLYSFNQPSLGYSAKGSAALIWKATIHPTFTDGQVVRLRDNITAVDWGPIPREEAAAVRCIKDSE